MTLLLQGAGLQAVSSSGGPTLPQVSSATLLLDLRASQLTLTDGDPVTTWTDKSGLGHDFTQTGSARPTYRMVGGVAEVDFDGVDDWLLGQNWSDMDNLPIMSAIAHVNMSIDSLLFNFISKYWLDGSNAGWVLEDTVPEFLVQKDGSNFVDSTDTGTGIYDSYAILTGEAINRSEAKVYQNGIFNLNPYFSMGTVDTYATIAPVAIGAVLDSATGQPAAGFAFNKMNVRSFLVYKINDYTAWNATDRAAIETWLAGNP